MGIAFVIHMAPIPNSNVTVNLESWLCVRMSTGTSTIFFIRTVNFAAVLFLL